MNIEQRVHNLIYKAKFNYLDQNHENITDIAKEYARHIIQSAIDKTYIADDNFNPIITVKELINIRDSI